MGGSVGNSISNAWEDTDDFIGNDTRRDEKRSLKAEEVKKADAAKAEAQAKQATYEKNKIDRARLFATAGGGAGVLTSNANIGRKQFFGQ